MPIIIYENVSPELYQWFEVHNVYRISNWFKKVIVIFIKKHNTLILNINFAEYYKLKLKNKKSSSLT